MKMMSVEELLEKTKILKIKLEEREKESNKCEYCKSILSKIEESLYAHQDLGNVIGNKEFLDDVKKILSHYKIELLNNKLKFYNLTQNNSGGYYIKNDEVDVFISIQAQNVKEAKQIAERILDDYRSYCPCCGERWDDYYLEEDDSTDTPHISGKPYKEQNDAYWCKNNKLIIYYYNGTKEIYDLNQNLKGEK